MKKKYKRAFKKLTIKINEENISIDAIWSDVCADCFKNDGLIICKVFSRKCLKRIRQFYLK